MDRIGLAGRTFIPANVGIQFGKSITGFTSIVDLGLLDSRFLGNDGGGKSELLAPQTDIFLGNQYETEGSARSTGTKSLGAWRPPFSRSLALASISGRQ